MREKLYVRRLMCQGSGNCNRHFQRKGRKVARKDRKETFLAVLCVFPSRPLRLSLLGCLEVESFTQVAWLMDVRGAFVINLQQGVVRQQRAWTLCMCSGSTLTLGEKVFHRVDQPFEIGFGHEGVGSRP